MGNTYTSLNYHIVFSTKYRELRIAQSMERQIWSMIAGAGRRHGLTPMIIGGFENHIHALVGIPASIAVADAVKYLKGVSSRQIGLAFPDTIWKGWQDGYGAFGVSASLVPTVRKYIATQRQHHADEASS